jgi:hypothetical protein
MTRICCDDDDLCAFGKSEYRFIREVGIIVELCEEDWD